MTQPLSTLNSFTRQYLGLLIGELKEDQVDEVPIEGLHSVRWVLSHLAVTGDYGLRLLGLPMTCPREWLAAYGPGSSGLTHPEAKPTVQELIARIGSIYEQLAQGLESASPDLLAQPHGLALLQRTSLQTKGDLLSHLLTTHFAVHLGQLSAMRRQMGLPHLF